MEKFNKLEKAAVVGAAMLAGAGVTGAVYENNSFNNSLTPEVSYENDEHRMMHQNAHEAIDALLHSQKTKLNEFVNAGYITITDVVPLKGESGGYIANLNYPKWDPEGKVVRNESKQLVFGSSDRIEALQVVREALINEGVITEQG